MDIGSFVRELVAHPLSDPVPEVIPIGEPLTADTDAQDRPVPAER